MTSEALIDPSLEAGLPEKRLSAPFAVLLWTVSIVCIGFTMCYAYHIGL